jgi:hypothetical protein
LSKKTAAGIAADGRFSSKNRTAYFGYLNSGAAFSASLVVFIDASHLSFLSSCRNAKVEHWFRASVWSNQDAARRASS